MGGEQASLLVGHKVVVRVLTGVLHSESTPLAKVLYPVTVLLVGVLGSLSSFSGYEVERAEVLVETEIVLILIVGTPHCKSARLSRV